MFNQHYQAHTAYMPLEILTEKDAGCQYLKRLEKQLLHGHVQHLHWTAYWTRWNGATWDIQHVCNSRNDVDPCCVTEFSHTLLQFCSLLVLPMPCSDMLCMHAWTLTVCLLITHMAARGSSVCIILQPVELYAVQSLDAWCNRISL